ncbi:MAG: TPR end-of-group domain-containing protein [Acidobacteriota bacterium]
MMQEARPAAPSRKKSSTVTAKPDSHSVVIDGPAFQHYQAAVQLLQQGRYEKAIAALEKLLPEAPFEIRERCKMYIATCRRQLEKVELAFETPEEHYDYAISQLNTGYYEEAREQFNTILERYPRADYAYYGLAVLDAMTGRAQECLDNLTQAIEMNPKNRLQARADNDFQSMADDPRFTELLYPEIP